VAKASLKIRSLARAHTESAITVLKSIMLQKDAPPASRIAAANELLSRGWGKPSQSHEISGSEGNPIEIIKRVIVDSTDDKDG
jgi:hypothetical protein